MMNFVIARHKEDILWLDDLPGDARIYLYNEGPEIEAGRLRHPGLRIIPLRNTGGKSGTYIHHLMHHFDEQQGEFTVFAQANPFEHSPRFLDLVDSARHWRDVQPLSVQWVADKDIPPRAIVEGDRRDWIGDIPVRPECFSLHTWAPLAFMDEGAWTIGAAYRQKHLLGSGANVMEHFLSLCGLDRLARQARSADLGMFSYGAMLAVRHHRIAAFLEQARPHLDKIELLTRADPDYGDLFERAWMHFYGEPFIRFAPLSALPSRDDGDPAPPPPVEAGQRHPGGDSIEDLRLRAAKAVANGDRVVAIGLLARAHKAAPSNHLVLCDLSEIALEQGDLASAESLARGSLALCEGHAPSRSVLAEVHRKKAGATDARDDSLVEEPLELRASA